MYESSKMIDAEAVAELPDGTWYVEYREVQANNQITSRRIKAEGAQIASIRTELQAHLANGTLPVGRVRVSNAQSVHIKFGDDAPAISLSIHLPAPPK